MVLVVDLLSIKIYDLKKKDPNENQPSGWAEKLKNQIKPKKLKKTKQSNNQRFDFLFTKRPKYWVDFTEKTEPQG